MQQLTKQTTYTGTFLSEALAVNFANQKVNRDPVLFPSLAAEDILANWPLTIIQTSEFDNYRQSCMLFKDKLQAAGRLLEYLDYAGCIHAFFLEPQFKACEEWFEDLKKAVDEYL